MRGVFVMKTKKTKGFYKKLYRTDFACPKMRMFMLALLALWISMACVSGNVLASCKFWTSDTAKYGAQGDTAALVKNGFVKVVTPAVYPTYYTVEVGLWVDDDLAARAADIPALVLTYFEHANCIFAMGNDTTKKKGVHQLSLKIAGNGIHYYKQTSPKIAGMNAYWLQQTHHDWAKAIKALGKAAPKVNLLFSSADYVEIGTLDKNGKVATWVERQGASNGVGQGQALVGVDPGAFRNVGKPNNEDWWGDIAAHELGHSLGYGYHLPTKFDTMCCAAPVAYGNEPGHTPSSDFYLSDIPWQAILDKNASSEDNCPDPYATKPNPVTGEKWNYPQISDFLVYNPTPTPKQKCISACGAERDQCMSAVNEPGHQLPKQCVQMYKVCVAGCK
jgi:hypothetical protein